MTSKPCGRIDDIEALRAIAVLITIFGHLGANFIPHCFSRIILYASFYSGVDLFFAISGFVIARGILKNLSEADSNEHFWRMTIAFWIKRAFRIWPTSWLWLSIILMASLIFKNMHIMSSPQVEIADLTASVLQVQNIHLWECNLGHSQCGDGRLWWSLSLEEQFYIVLPLAVLVFRKRFLYFLGAVVLLQLFMPRPVWTLPWAVRTDALCLGVLLAVFSRHSIYKLIQPTFMEARRYAMPTVLFLAAILVYIPENGPQSIMIAPVLTGLVAIVSITLVFIASFDGDYIVRSRYAKPVFLWVGTRSYALYLIHFPAWFMTRAFWVGIEPQGTIFGTNYALRYFLTWLVLTALLTEFNYRCVEKPLRRRGHEVARRIEAGLVATNDRSAPESRGVVASETTRTE